MIAQSWFLTLCTLALFVLIQPIDAAKFIRNFQSRTCLGRTSVSSSTSGCFTVSMASCPIDRFGTIPDSLKWNIIGSNPSNAASNNTDFWIETVDNKLCLAASTSNTVEACSCDSGNAGQKWKVSGDNLVNGGKCLTTISNNVGFSNCQDGSLFQWKVYHASPDSVTVYTGTLFTQTPTRLTINSYTPQKLPSAIFSTAYSLEIPPGFQFVINHGNQNMEIFESDMAQLNPIEDLTSTVEVRLKSGMILYEQAAYFGRSQYVEMGNFSIPKTADTMLIGSVMVPDGFRGVMWQSSNSSGESIALFEPIANFTGVVTSTPQTTAGSLDVSASTCSTECGSGGYCSAKNKCTCKPGFTGARCENCLPGFWGPSCQACPISCGSSTHFICDDGVSGTGKCKTDQCAQGFFGPRCDQCAPGFFGPNCKPCNCGNGVCDSQGKCSCNAGWANDQNNNSTQCTIAKQGYYLVGDDVQACSPGCASCSPNSGKCVQCNNGLKVSTDNPANCVPNEVSTCSKGQFFDGTQCSQCNVACETCYGSSAGECLSCTFPNFYMEGSCVPTQTNPDNGKCQQKSNSQTVFFAVNDQGLCEPCPRNCLDCSIPNFNSVSQKK